jgi:hypothetical protein
MVTYKGSSTNAEVSGPLALVAVGCTDNRVGVDEGASAVVANTAQRNADDERHVTLGSGDTTNDVLGSLIPVLRELLGDGSTVDEGRNRKGGEDGLGVHVDGGGIGTLKRKAGRSLS